MKNFLVTALEPSANLHLKEVLKAYKAEFGSFELFGIFDEKLMQELNDKGLNSKQDLNLNSNESQAVNSLNSSQNSNKISLNSSENSKTSLNSNEPKNSKESDENSKNEIIIHKPLYSSHEFCAMGFVEVLPLIFKAKRAIKELVSLALERQNVNSQENLANLDTNSSQIQKSSKPFDAVLCIDSPAFNIPLAKALNSAGVKAKKIYYILPQVWAWKRGRVPIIEANFDELASILPFDSQFFSKSTFVGHPLLDEIKDFKSAEQMQGIVEKEERKKIISFLPGSRRSEIVRLMPVFRELAKNFSGEKILCVPPFNLTRLDELYGDTSAFKVVSNTPQALKKSDFAFICSGTATLEAALIGTPFILAYKAKAIDVLIARFFVKLKHIGLANIMCDFAGKSELNPEFLQNEVSAKNLFEAYRKFKYKPFFDKVSFLKNYLRFGSAKNLAKMLSRSDNANRTDE